MVLTLAALDPDLTPVRDQILSGSTVPSLDEVFARLLHVSSPTIVHSPGDSSVLVSQSHTFTKREQGDRSGRGNRPKCNYYHR